MARKKAQKKEEISEPKGLTEEQKKLFDQLTNLQKMTCAWVLKGKSNREAYYLAGGKATNHNSADAAVARMLGSVKVDAFLTSVQQNIVSEAIMTREEALERLTKMARGDVNQMADFRTVEITSASGETVKQTVWSFRDSVLQDPDQLSNITELAATKDGLKFKIHDAKQAIKQLSDMQGWNAPEKREISGPDGQSIKVNTISADLDPREAAKIYREVIKSGLQGS